MDQYPIDLKNEETGGTVEPLNIASTVPYIATQKKEESPQIHQYSENQNFQQQSKINKSNSKLQGCTRFFHLQFYQQFFQVTQSQVFERLTLSLIPIKREFMYKIKPNPDFYGPLWILTTIIFLLGSTSNLSRYFANWQKNQYIFRLELVRYGVVVVYSFGLGIPLLLYFIITFNNVRTITLPDFICIYGYSFTCFIIVFVFCIIPFDWLQWILMVYGMLNSIAFLVLNLLDQLADLDKKKMYVVFGIIGASQIAIFLLFKLLFFDLIYTPSS